MPAKIVVSLSSRSVGIAYCERGALREYHGHDDEKHALAVLQETLTAHPDTPIDIMVDTAEEEFRAEQLPRVRSLAQREMVQRKLTQLFRTATYRTSWLLGPAGGKRGDNIHVFAALSASEFLRPYVDLIHSRHAPLAGIYLLAQATQALVERLKLRGATLVVSSQQAGLRQSLFLDGRLRISRLAAVEPDNVTAEGVANEIEKSRLFFYNSRVLPRDMPLHIVVLDPADHLAETTRWVPTEPGIACEVLGSARLSSITGLPLPLLPRDAQALHLYLLGRHRPAHNLAAPRLTGAYLTRQIRDGLYAASAAILVIGATWGVINLFNASAAVDEEAGTRSQASRYRAAYADAAKQFPAAPATATQMQQAVDNASKLRELARTPESFLIALSQSLDDFPQIELDRIVWKVDDATDPSRPQAQPKGEHGEIEAEIRPFNGDYRSALQMIERFASAVRARPGMSDVTVTKLPLNLDPTTTLSGSARDATDEKALSAKFTLALRWRPTP